MSIEKLRKKKKNGQLYNRPATIEAYIAQTLDWPFDRLIEQATIHDRRHAEYVPSEVLLYHLRQTKSDNSDARFLALYNIIQDRVEAACPRANTMVGDRQFEDARLAEIRDLMVEFVVDLIFEDRLEYSEKLDFFEIRFDRAVRLVRINKFRRVGRKENPKESLEYDDSGDIPADVEEALERLKKASWNKEDELTYRIHVRRAIDALPTEEQKVIDMILADIPIEAQDEDEVCITGLLGCTPKTVWNRRNRAIKKTREALSVEGYDV